MAKKKKDRRNSEDIPSNEEIEKELAEAEVVEANKPSNTDLDDAMAESQASEVMSAIDKNRSMILALVALVVLGVMAVLVLNQLKKNKHKEAGQAFSEAVAKNDIAALDGVVVNHAGSVGAGNALLSKAELQIDQGKAQDAQATLEKFTGEYADHPRAAQGLFALANLHHVAGAGEKAKSYYEETIAAQEDGELTPLSRIRLGDLALEAGDKDAADQHYQDSYIKHPGNPFFAMAEEKLALMKLGTPPVVDAPKPPPPPPAEPEKKAEEPKPAPAAKPAAAKPTDAPKPGNADKPKAPAKPKADGGKKAPAKAKAKAGNAIEKGKAKAKAAAKKAGETGKKAGQKAKEAVKKGGNALKKAAEKAGEAVKEAAE